MKRKIALFLALVMLAAVSVIALPAMAEGEEPSEADKEAAAKVAALIDAIYVQQRTETTDADCAAAKAAWDALTDLQKSLVEGEEADPDYFGRDTGDASKDDPRNADEIGEWAVRRAFTAQIIINHVQARDGEFIDNMDQALERAVKNGVKNLIVQPTHLMHGAEYDELVEAVTKYADKFATVTVAEPLLGQVGADAAAVNNDKQTVAEAVVAAAVADGGFSSLHAAEKDGTAIVLMGHGTAHSAKVTYSQMQTMMRELGYKNVFIGTVEGEPEETACEEVIKAVHEAGYTKVILRPLMVVAGDHANNDMADPEDEESWFSMFTASGLFTDVQCQIAGLGRIETVQKLYVNHAQAAVYAMAPANETDAEAGARVGKLIDAIYVQQRTETTDAQCAAAKAAWDALTDAQKELVEGEEADPDYFGRDTGDAKLDDPLNKNGIGENELLVVSFGTSFNESRAEDIGGIEKARVGRAPGLHRPDHHQPRPGPGRRVHRQHGPGPGPRRHERRQEPDRPAHPSHARRRVRRAGGGCHEIRRQDEHRGGRAPAGSGGQGRR